MKLNDGRIFASLVSDVVNNRSLIIKSDGKAVRPFCYISDTVSALFTILLKGKNGEAYNISNPTQSASVNLLAKNIANIFPEKKIKIIRKNTLKQKYVNESVRIQKPDISKIKKLGWRPTVSI